jgi:hypothetical protein
MSSMSAVRSKDCCGTAVVVVVLAVGAEGLASSGSADDVISLCGVLVEVFAALGLRRRNFRVLASSDPSIRSIFPAGDGGGASF